MAYEVTLTTRITGAVDRRLRMLALIRSQSLSSVIDSVLDEALPAAGELASQLGADARRTDEAEAVA